MAEINGLLNRRRALKLYRGFESLPHRWTREVAQAGSAPGLGPGGRRFESCLPDKTNKASGDCQGFFCFEAMQACLLMAEKQKNLDARSAVRGFVCFRPPHFKISAANPVFPTKQAR